MDIQNVNTQGTKYIFKITTVKIKNICFNMSFNIYLEYVNCTARDTPVNLQ